MNQILYAVGDIHGDFDQLQTVLARIDADCVDCNIADQKTIFIGDLVDRRDDSKRVIDYLMDGIAAGRPWIVLKGNHDRMFSLFFDNPHVQDPKLRSDLTWLNPRLGGLTTLASYGVDVIRDQETDRLHAEACEKVPAAHRAFLKDLPSYYETDDYFFAHAGVNPKLPLDHQSEDDLIWIRAPFHEHKAPYPKLIIHGHTPVPSVTHYGNRINIDTGAAYGDALSAIVMDGAEIFELTAVGRQKLKVIS
ncbi:MAG: metallophosphoesterase [Pseudomonadota bacterium]